MNALARGIGVRVRRRLRVVALVALGAAMPAPRGAPRAVPGAVVPAPVASSPRVPPAGPLPAPRPAASRPARVLDDTADDTRARARARNREGVKLLEEGRVVEAIAALEDAVRLDPLESVFRKNLAAALSHRAAAQREASHPAAAAETFARASRFDPAEPDYRYGQAVSLFEAGDLPAAGDVLEDLESRAPADPRGAKLLGTILYREGRLAEAIEWWEFAVAAGESEGVLERLRQARRELEVEGDLFLVPAIHFDVRAPSDETGIETARRAAALLERIQEEGGRRLGVFPRERIQVILYPKGDFAKITDVHGWVAGLFDGKIRVPIPRGAGAGEALRRVLRHEYAHWAIRTRARDVPSWVHEGIAQVFEGESLAASRRLLAAAAKEGGAPAPSLRDLDLSPRADVSPEQVRRGYARAHAFFGWIEATWGPSSIARFLDRMEEGASVEDALRSVTGLAFDALEGRFRETL